MAQLWTGSKGFQGQRTRVVSFESNLIVGLRRWSRSVIDLYCLVIDDALLLVVLGLTGGMDEYRRFVSSLKESLRRSDVADSTLLRSDLSESTRKPR